ncbi:MAG: hypothetical protein SFY68_05375 [Candidatus Sumerlaeia bacterium]|nr:hypothetical protein [Candidatus Sumerlaeia bacterium]
MNRLQTKLRILLKAAATTFCGGLFILVIGVLLLSGVVHADRLVLQDGREFTGVLTTDYRVNPAGATFLVRMRLPGQTAFADHPIEVEKLLFLQFDEPEASLAGTGERTYRKANIRLKSGEILESIWVGALRLQGDELVLIARPGSSFPPDNQPLIPLSQVQEILLVQRDEIPEARMAQVDTASLLQATPDPLTPEELHTDAPIGTQLLGGGNYVGEEIIGGMDLGSGDSPSSFADEDEYRYEDDESDFMSLGEEAGFITIPFIGLSMGVVALIVFIVANICIEGGYLYMATRIEGVHDFPLWKAVVTSAALTFIPAIAFLIVSGGINFFVGGLGLSFIGDLAGIFTFSFLIRAIVMGSVEVLEEKAGSILMNVFFIKIVVLILAASLF